MRHTVAAALMVICGLATAAHAQQPASPVSLGAVHAGLLRPSPSLVLRTPDPPLPPDLRPTRLGVFTLEPPDTRGGVVKVKVPVGAMVMGAARGVSNAQHRRAERAADRRVQEDLRAFLAQQQKP